jgi:hypothetical protein
MKTIKVRPVQVIGRCPAGVTLEDEFEIEGMNLRPTEGTEVCFLTLSHFPINVWQLQSESRFFSHSSCPGCTSRPEEENRVVFLLGHADKWELCQFIAEYLALGKQCEESEAARRLKEKAIEHQGREAYDEAAQKMRAALEEMKRGAAP